MTLPKQLSLSSLKDTLSPEFFFLIQIVFKFKDKLCQKTKISLQRSSTLIHAYHGNHSTPPRALCFPLRAHWMLIGKTRRSRGTLCGFFFFNFFARTPFKGNSEKGVLGWKKVQPRRSHVMTHKNSKSVKRCHRTTKLLPR